MSVSPRRWVRKPLVQFDARPRIMTHGFQVPTRIVIHDTESHDAKGIRDMEGIVNYWARQGQGLGAHLIIDADGNSTYGAAPDRITYAVRRRNTGTVHIELVGFARFTPKMWFLRKKQLAKCAKWCAWLNYEFGIPLVFDVNKGISGHRHQPGQDHTDPGLGFPMKWLIRRANQFRDNGWT